MTKNTVINLIRQDHITASVHSRRTGIAIYCLFRWIVGVNRFLTQVTLPEYHDIWDNY